MTLKINHVEYFATGQQSQRKRSSGVAIMANLKINEMYTGLDLLDDSDTTNINDIAEKIYQKQQRLLKWIECNPKAFAKVNMQEWVDKNDLFVFVRKTLKNGLSEISIVVDSHCAYTNWFYNPTTGEVVDKDFETAVFNRALKGFVQLGVVSSFYAEVKDGFATC